MSGYEAVKKEEIFHLQKCKEKLQNLISTAQNTLTALDSKQMSIPQKMLNLAVKDAETFLEN